MSRTLRIHANLHASLGKVIGMLEVAEEERRIVEVRASNVTVEPRREFRDIWRGEERLETREAEREVNMVSIWVIIEVRVRGLESS